MTNPVGRPQKYPWGTWFDGREHTFDLSELECGLTTLRTNACRHARVRGLKVSIHTVKTKVGKKITTHITMKATPINGKRQKSKRKLIRSR
jgi:hypothetical protein